LGENPEILREEGVKIRGEFLFSSFAFLGIFGFAAFGC
jgi:hypothetical protein